MPRLTLAILAVLVMFSTWQFGSVGMIQAKAWLAPVLIENAWERSLATGQPSRPWSWADTWPVAKLTVPSLGIEQYVLAGANGASLPFGPGHVGGTSVPGESGRIAIAGHRDTHFWFLDQLGPGDEIHLESWAQPTQRFAVIDSVVVDARKGGIEPGTTASELVLVTCEPTNAFTSRGAFRLVVTAINKTGVEPRFSSTKPGS